MVEFALGDLGLKLHDFLSITWFEYSQIVAANIKHNARKWEHTRFVAYWIYWANTDTDRDSITDFYPLITDPDPEEQFREPLSAEDISRITEDAEARIILFKNLKNG